MADEGFHQTFGECLSEVAIRAARAEMERDAAIKRAEYAEDMLRVRMRRDPDEMLENLHIMGIPARDLKELYDMEAKWREKQKEATA